MYPEDTFKWTPKVRVMSGLFGGRKPARAPVANPTSIICHDIMDKAGIGFPEAHLDADLMADLAEAAMELTGFDCAMPEFSVQQEAAALGCEIDWGGRDMMPDAVTHPAKSSEDIEIPENILEKPSMRVVLDAISILRKRIGDHYVIIGKVMGPWTLSYHMLGTQEFLLRTLTETEDCLRCLDKLKEVTYRFATAQFQAGADIVVLADHATGDLISPKMYREMLLPVHKELVERIGGPLILHVCGNCSDRLESFAEAGFACYHFEQQVDAKDAIRRVGDRMSLVGNINNPVTLLSGTPEDVAREVRYALEAGVHIIAPECAIPLQTPLENLRAIVETVEECSET